MAFVRIIFFTEVCMIAVIQIFYEKNADTIQML